jgi:aromatic ring hydroxylase
VIEGDLSMTHTIVHANIDKSVGDLAGMNTDLTLRVVGRNENGIIVRGGKVLATLGPMPMNSMSIPRRRSRRAAKIMR